MVHYEPYVEFRTDPLRISLAKASGENVFITIAPGTSFGSDHHTTKLCLRAMEDFFKTKEFDKVLDIGCGSGILAISTAKLGAKSIVAIDVDPLSIREAVRNAQINKSIYKIRFIHGSIESLNDKFNLIVANIVTDKLVLMVGDIRKCMEENGDLVVSGISELKKEKLIKSFLEEGLRLRKEFYEGGWVSLVFEQSNL